MMRKAVILLLLASLVAIGFAANTIQADPDPAVVVKDIYCVMLDGYGNFIITDNSQAVGTPSDNSKITCRAKDVSTPGGNIKYNYANTGLYCYTAFDGLTMDWEEVLTPSGEAKLTCHVNPNPK